MSEPTIKQILRTAEGIKEKPMSTPIDHWDVTVDAIEALRMLVHYTDNNHSRCFCDQWKDPESLGHSGACLCAQEVLRRADSL